MERSKLRSLQIECLPRLRCEHRVGGVRASSENQLMVTEFYEAWTFLAEDVMIQSCASDESICSKLDNFILALEHLDVAEVLGICLDAANSLIRNEQGSYCGFKAHLYELHPESEVLIGKLLSPIQSFLVAIFDCPDVKAESLPAVLSFLRFGKKLNFESIGLEEKALASYKETEQRLALVDLYQPSDLLIGLNRLMRFWLKDLDLTRLKPKHGSGSVAEGSLSLYDKYHELGDDLYLRIVLGPFWSEFFPVGSKGDFARESRTIFVPKTFDKLRTISMEPATLQYFQQGVMHELYKHIEEHPYLGTHVRLRDQTQNQRLAKEGSITGLLSTIDLSSASDSVSWALVKAVFAGTPLLKWLYATRSKSSRMPTGESMQLRKFAPMGSALCFPVECLIFAAVVEYESQKWCSQTRLAKPTWSVYGDDIVVASDITDSVIQSLTEIGFQVNVGKTFTRGPFRESCGCDYYEGIDVSSVYYRLPAYVVDKLSPDVFASLCSCANLAYERGYARLREYYISILLRKNRTRPFFTDTALESPHLYSPSPTNYHSRDKWNEDWQIWEASFCSVLSKPNLMEPSEVDQLLGYFEKLVQLSKRPLIGTLLTHLVEPSEEQTLHGARTRLGYVAMEVDHLSR